MDPKELAKRLDDAIKRLGELREKETLTDDESREVDQNIRAVNELGPLLQGAMVAEASRESAGRLSVATRGGARELSDEEIENAKPFGQRFAELPDIARYERSMPMSGNVAMEVPGGSLFPRQSRALVTTGVFPADYVEPQRIEGIMRWDDPFGSLRDVLPVGQTNSDSVIFFRELLFTNAAAEVAEATAVAGASGLKPEAAITFEQDSADVVTIAHWIPITKQTLWRAPELRSYIEGRLVDGLRLREDDQLLNGTGTPPDLTGLLATADIQVLDATYFGTNPVADGGTPNENFNRIKRAQTLVATVGRARASFVVVNPEDDEVFTTSTDGQQQYFGAGPFAAGVASQLWGMRKVVNENIAAGTALVGDGRGAMIWDRMAATVSAGWANDDFIRNMIRLLAEERVGLTVFRPQAFAEVTLAALV